jgi:hypothetical protein
MPASGAEASGHPFRDHWFAQIPNASPLARWGDAQPFV